MPTAPAQSEPAPPVSAPADPAQSAPTQSAPVPPESRPAQSVPTASVNGAATFISTPASASAVSSSTIIPVSSRPEEDNAPTITGTPPGKVLGATPAPTVPPGSSLSIGPVSTSFGVATVPTTIVTDAPGTDARGSSIRTRMTITTSTEITTSALVTPIALVSIAHPSDKSHASIATTIGVIIGAFFIVLGISTVIFLRRRRRRRLQGRADTGEGFIQAFPITLAQTTLGTDEKRDVLIVTTLEETGPALDPFADPRMSQNGYSAFSVNASTAPPPYLSREPSLAGSL